MIALQCVRIVDVMGLSHGDYFPQGLVRTHRIVVSRKPLCFSGDGVLKCNAGNSVERGSSLSYLTQFDSANPLQNESSIAVLRTSAAALHRALGAKDRPATHPAASRAACDPRDLRKHCYNGGTRAMTMNRIPPSITATSEAGTAGYPPL
jgi:hypothetical protein